jgi:chromosome partitioning protein
MRVISVINQKGGVGKTTTVANLSHALALANKKVLILDLDPQAHLTACFGFNPYEESGMDEVLLDGDELSDYFENVRTNLTLVPAGPRLAQVEHHASSKKMGELLKKEIAKLEGWDFVIVDAPPSSGLLVIMAMYAAEEVLIPVTGDYLGMQGLSHLMGTLHNFEKRLNHSVREWIVMTRFHLNRKLAKEVQIKLVEHFPDSVLKTPIREIVALASCPSYGQTIFEFDKRSKGAADYEELAQDLLNERTLS